MSDLADLRRRVMGWRAAERRERLLQAQQGPVDPGESLETAIDLLQLLPNEVSGPDIVRTREIGFARAAWRKLRVRLASPAAPPRTS
jgi:hypothetical protein